MSEEHESQKQHEITSEIDVSGAGVWAFSELVRRIRELSRKDKQTETEKKNLERLFQEKVNRRELAKKDKDHKSVFNKIDKLLEQLENIFKNLAASTSQNREELKKKAEKTEKQLRQLAGEKDGPLEELIKGVFTDYLQEKLDSIKGQYKVAPEQSGQLAANIPDIELQQWQQKIEGRNSEIQRLFITGRSEDREKAFQMLDELNKEQAFLNKQVMRQLGLPEAGSTRVGLGAGYTGYGYSPAEKNELEEAVNNNDDVTMRRYFMDLMSRYGQNPNDEFASVDWNTTTKKTDFLTALSKNPDLVRKFSMLFTFEQTAHNLEFHLGGQVDISRINEFVNHMQSGMFDLALRQPGAVVAFRAYEEACNRLALIDEKFTAKKVLLDPDTGKSWLDNWATERTREILKADYQAKFEAAGESSAKAKELAEAQYKEVIEPHEAAIMRTGHKIFTFTLRGDEIQAELPSSRDPSQTGAPLHEDMLRVLDPLSLPLRYWGGIKGVEGFLRWGSDQAEKNATALWFFYTGHEKRFKNPEQYIQAMEVYKASHLEGIEDIKHSIDSKVAVEGEEMKQKIEFDVVMKKLDDLKKAPMSKSRKAEITALEEEIKGAGKDNAWALYQARMARVVAHQENQVNIFDIGGILSNNDWRVKGAAKYIPDAWARFLGVDFEHKKLGWNQEAKRIALTHARIRNPFRLFMLADTEDKEEILKMMGIDKNDEKEYPDEKKYKEAVNKFYEQVYDDMAKALQLLVNRQQQEMKVMLLEPEDDPKRDVHKGDTREVPEDKIKAFLEKEKDKELDFSFVQDDNQRKILKNFTAAIQNHFEQKKALDRLVNKHFPFSLGTDDAALELMRFTENGEIALQRRYRDLHSSAKAVGTFRELISNLGPLLQNEQEVIKVIKSIHSDISSYNADIADKTAQTLCSRVIDLLMEDKVQEWLPWPFDRVRDSLMNKWGLTSKAEKMFGQQHLSINKEQARKLIQGMVAAGFFSKRDPLVVAKELYKKHHLGAKWIILQKLEKYSILIPVGLTFSLLTILWQELKKIAEKPEG